MSFKVGQKIVCIDDSVYGIEKGEVYTVKEILENRAVSLIEIDPEPTYSGWLFRFFAPIEENSNSDEWVESILESITKEIQETADV